VLPGLEPDKKLVWTYFEAMVPDRMPKSLLVVGSGAIGIEFASFFHTMGSDVTVVEVLPQILPVEDAEIGGLARKRLRRWGSRSTPTPKSQSSRRRATAWSPASTTARARFKRSSSSG
jgi:dihydrolipoamide dehydrogenase